MRAYKRLRLMPKDRLCHRRTRRRPESSKRVLAKRVERFGDQYPPHRPLPGLTPPNIFPVPRACHRTGFGRPKGITTGRTPTAPAAP
jgi:hypothetical protein